MKFELIDNQDGTTTIQVNFLDEGVNLPSETTVKGGESAAVTYLPVFETDLRRNFADLFPAPEMPAMPEGGLL